MRNVCDIQFIRFIDISSKNSTIEFRGWERASTKIYDHLCETLPQMSLDRLNKTRKMKIPSEIKEVIEYLIKLKEKRLIIERKKFQINQVKLVDEDFICIIADANLLFAGVCFNLYIMEEGIEKLVAMVECFHVQPDGIAQVKILNSNVNLSFLEEILSSCNEKGNYVLGEHRLELQQFPF